MKLPPIIGMVLEDMHASNTDTLASTGLNGLTFQGRSEQATPFFVHPERAETYLHAAVGGAFLQLPQLLRSNDCMAYRVIERGGNEYERLGIPVNIKFGLNSLAGMEFSASLHFFNTRASEEHHEAPGTRIDLHDHLMPIGILPFHPEAKLGETAYQMVRATTDADGKIVSQDVQQVRFGEPYVMLDPIHDLHAISSSQPHYSLMLAHTNGLRNSRESHARLFANPERTAALIDMACAAQEATHLAFLERWGRSRSAAGRLSE